jgi:ElaB protein
LARRRGADLLPGIHAYIGHMNPNDLAGDLKVQTKQALEKAGDQFSEQASHLRDLATDARYHGEDFIQTNPWLAVSVAAGLGFIVGAIVARR